MTEYTYKCPGCGAIGPDIIQQCCTSNRVYVTHNLKTDKWIYDCDDVEQVEFTSCTICGYDLPGNELEAYVIEV